MNLGNIFHAVCNSLIALCRSLEEQEQTGETDKLLEDGEFVGSDDDDQNR